jgi:hypothetical protein
MQRVSPVCDWLLPLAHNVHSMEFVRSEKLPAAHDWHASRPATEANVPLAHGIQLAWPLRPCAVPARQLVQDLEEVTLANEPYICTHGDRWQE